MPGEYLAEQIEKLVKDKSLHVRVGIDGGPTLIVTRADYNAPRRVISMTADSFYIVPIDRLATVRVDGIGDE